MNISPINRFNYQTTNLTNNYRIQNQQVAFGGGEAVQSNLFKPAKKAYLKMVIWLRENYHKRLLNSKFTKWFADKSDKLGDMTKHMMVLGSTIISGMYIVKTLQNDNLDKDKRKTLALNDLLTWGVSTIGAYSLDKSLNKMWEGQTRKYTALYIKKYTDPEFLKRFEESEAKIKAEMERKGQKYTRPDADYTDLAEKCKAAGVTAEDLNKNILESQNKRKVENLKIELSNKLIKEQNDKNIKEYLINKFGYTAEQLNKDESIFASFEKMVYKMLKSGAKLPEELNIRTLTDKLPEINNVKSFNTEVIKFKPLSNKLGGFSSMKSIIIFGLMYRYIVPVLVMKPANWIGNYYHKKQAEKQQARKA